MPSFSTRYRDGEHEAVWNELRGLGPVPESLSDDVTEVAAETMRRVRRHAERLADAYLELGFTGLSDAIEPLPEAADLAKLDRLAAEIGGIPYALDACMRHVGSVGLMGDCEPLDLWYTDTERVKQGPVLPDPIATPPVFILEMDWNGYDDDYGPDSLHDEEMDGDRPGFTFGFAPDELHKANFSGGTHDVELPSTVADPVLHGVGGRPGITLVEYLRLSIAWGGLPGWSRTEAEPPAALRPLRVLPDF